MNDSWEFENENVTAEVRVWVVRGLKKRITHTSLLGVRIDLFPLAASCKTLKKKKKVSLTLEEIRARAQTVSHIRRRA